MEKKLFVRDDFLIPEVFETDHYRLRMLSVEDVEKDYDAVMESRSLLRSMSGGGWPREGFTLEENLRDLERHQQEFMDRKAFAYTVVSLDETEVLGCLYINPPGKYEADAVVHMWVRQREFDKGMDAVLFEGVRDWLKEAWPFESVIYPGRE